MQLADIAAKMLRGAGPVPGRPPDRDEGELEETSWGEASASKGQDSEEHSYEWEQPGAAAQSGQGWRHEAEVGKQKEEQPGAATRRGWWQPGAVANKGWWLWGFGLAPRPPGSGEAGG